MRNLDWKGDTEFEIDGVKFGFTLSDYSQKTTDERFVLLKDRPSLEQYASVFGTLAPKNVLEFGIFQGGSPAMFSLWFDLAKFVGIDICPPVVAFDRFCQSHAVGQRIRSYYETSQSDQASVSAIIQKEFGNTPLDAIIDDASHQYGHSRRTFEISFPYLRPGGIYVIEDWGWAHWPNYELKGEYAFSTPLSQLIMELTMLCASRGDLISEVRVFPAFTFIRKADGAPAMPDFSLDSLYLKRNIEISSMEHLNLGGIARLVQARIVQRTRRRLLRTQEKLRRAFFGKK